jgi:hypothetical protein
MSMTWTVLPWQELSDHAQAWDELNEQYSNASPILCTDFLLPALECFADPNVHLVRHAENQGSPDVYGLVEKRYRFSWELFRPSQVPVAALLMSNRQDTDVRVLRLMDTLPGRAMLLGLVRQDSIFSDLESFRKKRKIETFRSLTTTSIDARGTFEDYWANRKKGLRRTIRPRLRMIEDDGIAFQLVEITEPEVMRKAVAEHGRLESLGWKGKAGSAIAEDNVQGRFYIDMLERFARKGGAYVYQLLFDGSAVASMLSVERNGVLVVLKIGYDERFAKYAPGRVLDYLSYQVMFARPNFHKLEMYTDASEEDRRWATDSRDIVDYNVFRYSAVGVAHRSYMKLFPPSERVKDTEK